MKNLLRPLFLLALMACDRPDTDIPEPVTLPGEDNILVVVNEDAISQYDLEQSIVASLGQHALSQMNAEGRKQVLESLVASRVIAQQQEKRLSPRQQREVDKKVKAYREQLLVKRYLAENTTAEPVSQKMVEDYYHRHPEKFGARSVRRYEMIATDPLDDSQRNRWMPVLKHAGQEKDWPALVANLKVQGLEAHFTSGQVDPNVLRPKLRDLMASLKPGMISPPTFIDRAAYLVRITKEHRIPARPLTEVSARIRKMLLPVQLKKAVRKASEEARAQAEVKYQNE